MIYSGTKTTEDSIIELLAVQNATVAAIHDSLSSSGKSISIQALYDAVRSLMLDGVVLKHKKICSLSAEWKRRVADNLQTYSGFPRLEEGDHLTFAFHTYLQLDLYWKHINALFVNTNPQSPIFFFVSHQIWIYLQGREESQDAFLKSFTKSGRSAFTLVGNMTPVDVIFKKRYEKYHKIELESGTHIKDGEQLTTCGNFVVVTKIPNDVVTKIDSLYDSISEENTLRKELQKLFIEKQQLSVIVYHNKSRAERLRKRITRNMYIPTKERNLHGI